MAAATEQPPEQPVRVMSHRHLDDDLLDYLTRCTSNFKIASERQSISEEDLQQIVFTLKQNILSLETSGFDPTGYEVRLCLECLRCLRNACVQCNKNQNVLIECKIIDQLRSSVDITTDHISKIEVDGESIILMLRCTVQLTVNLISGNNIGQDLVWQAFFPETLEKIFRCHDVKVCHYCCMLLLTCLKQTNILKDFMSSTWNFRIVESVLKLSTVETDQDFSLQVINILISQDNFICEALENLNTSAMVILMDVIEAHLSQKQDMSGKFLILNSSVLETFAMTFEKLSNNVISLAVSEDVTKCDDDASLLVMKLLTILCLITSSPDQSSSSAVLHRESLLQCALELLKLVHQIGKQGDNIFTVTQTLKCDVVSTNPVHGFRRDIIRLIGNMCYRNTKNQDLVRELKGIPVILGQCNVDDENPFISQWTIFAIRNLCENNSVNQKFIADLKRQGLANNDTLKTFGFEAVTRSDGKVYLQNTNKR